MKYNLYPLDNFYKKANFFIFLNCVLGQYKIPDLALHKNIPSEFFETTSEDVPGNRFRNETFGSKDFPHFVGPTSKQLETFQTKVCTI